MQAGKGSSNIFSTFGKLKHEPMNDATLKLVKLYIDLPEPIKLEFLKELKKLEAIDISVRKDYEKILKSL